MDWHGGFLTIRRGLRKGVLSTTKSKKARRVDMSRQLQETLQALRDTRQEHAWTQGWTDIPEWVFCQEDGSLFCDVTVRTTSAIPMRPC